MALPGTVRSRAIWFAVSGLLAFVAAAQSARSAVDDFTGKSLEELMEIEITSVAKRPETVYDSPAAAFVITGEDIERSGATSIPEALRLAPGIEVAKVNASTWAITARGFNGRFANKLLVLIDGRTVYTPLFSGVFWDRQDTLLEDVARIEVIRGPGASLWGANAVNGVINIITRHASETHGTYAELATGTEQHGFGAIRYGGRVGDDIHYRAYAKAFSRDDQPLASGGDGGDSWKVGRAGFRTDWEIGPATSLHVQGGYYVGEAGEIISRATLSPPFSVTRSGETDISGGHALAQWSRNFSETSEFDVQAYYDHRSFEDIRIDHDLDTVDLDVQHTWAPNERHEIVWGMGYRGIWDEIDDTFSIGFDPDSEQVNLISAFAQDTIALVPEELDFTIGSKFEHNDYTGFEIQPTARLLWRPSQNQSVWGAVSRAVRTPSRAENDVRLNNQAIPPGAPGNPTALPAVTAIIGDRDADSEKLIAYEIGYRVQPIQNLSFDIAGFYNDYEDLIGTRLGSSFVEASPAPPHLVVPLQVTNNVEGQTYGFEVVGNWQARPWWRLQGTYSFLQIDLDRASSTTLASSLEDENQSPQHQASLRSVMDLRDDLDLDFTVRFVDALPGIGVDEYVALDTRIAWRPAPALEVALSGRNLLEKEHFEFGSEAELPTAPTKVERSVLLTLEWQF